MAQRTSSVMIQLPDAKANKLKILVMKHDYNQQA